MAGVDEDVPSRVRTAARAVARSGLADAFGHVSARIASDRALITPPLPLGRITSATSLVDLPLGPGNELPAGAPLEAWLHVALMTDPATGAVCRAQPPAVAAFAALGLPLPALSGHAAMLGPVAIHEDSRLVRDAGAATRVASALGAGRAIILRGNGAVTRGADLYAAVAAMWVLERSAELALRALAAGSPRPLPLDEAAWWADRADELLPRIAAYLMTEGDLDHDRAV